MKKLMIGLLTLALVLVCSLPAVLPVSASIALPPMVRITISPAKATISAGLTQAYVVTGYDADGKSYNVTWRTNFSIDAGAGGSWSGGQYTSAVKGTWTVTADYTTDSKSATATLTVTCGTPVSIALSPATGSVAAGSARSFCAVATDAVGNTFNVSGATDFSIDTGAGGTWAMGTYNMFYTAEVPGIWTVTATYGSLTPATAVLTVPHGPAVSLAISPAASSAAAGTNKSLCAVATDAWGNTFNVSGAANFSIDKGAGGTWAMGKYNMYYTPEVPGTWTVTATYGSLTATANLTVTHGVAVSLAISPAASSAAAGASKSLCAVATDAWGHTFNVSGAADFSIDAGAGGTWAMGTYNMYYTPEVPGVWTVTATYGSLTATATLTVKHGVAVSLAISPDNSSIPSGGIKSLCAVATDAWGNNFNVSGAADFSITKGAGGSWAMGTYNMYYTAGSPGSWTVTATYGSLTATAALRIK